jgi:hypothetical protein
MRGGISWHWSGSISIWFEGDSIVRDFERWGSRVVGFQVLMADE